MPIAEATRFPHTLFAMIPIKIETESIRTSSRSQMIEVTSLVQKIVSRHNVQEGFVIVHVPHTTAAITINENGIELPTGNLFQMRRVRIARKEIGAVLKHESFKGRLIQIITTSGTARLVQARHYCELNEFLSHCKRYGLPVA